jgi:hypothetical protein
MLLAVIVTTVLVVAYATAAYVNHLVLVPRIFASKRYGVYALLLGAVMVVLTALALGVIRASYMELEGLDPDPFGVYKHFAIDLFGMVVHVGAATMVVAVVHRISPVPEAGKLKDVRD